MSLKKSYKIIFAGTPAFSATTLRALLASHHQIQAVYTQPDRPAGRGRKLTPSAVKELALQAHLPIYQPSTLRDAATQATLADFQADVMVVVAYGLLLPAAVLTLPKLGCINVHASLLPRWRGAAPIQRAILAGDTTTGITIMQMDAGLDTGAILQKTECPITLADTSASLHDRLATLGAEALLNTLDQFNQLTAETQDATLATYAHKITKEEAVLNWQQSAVELQRQVRAFYGWPVAFTYLRGEILRVWEASVIEQATMARPGTILQATNQGIQVAAGQGILNLQTIQLPNARVLPVAEVLNGRSADFFQSAVLSMSAL